MSFLSNGNANNNARMAPKGPPERNSRADRDGVEPSFGSDLLGSSLDSETTSPRMASAPVYTPERPPAFGSSSSAMAPVAGTSSGPTSADKCANVIAAGAKWHGTLNVEDSVRIDGVFSGEIDAKGTIHVAEGAQVDAKIRGMYVVISGEFRGEIRCEQRVDLMPHSRVNGEVITKVLSVHEGATLDGSVKMSGGGELDNRRTAARVARNGSEGEVSERRERVGAVSNGVGRNGASDE